MASGKRFAGVTLIELLIVISIMMTLLSLVGGLSLQTFKKAEAQTELISFYSLIKKAGMLGFASGGNVVLELSGNAVTMIVRDEVRATKSFEYLSFKAEMIFFNRSGLPYEKSVLVGVNGLKKTVDLGFLFADLTMLSSEGDVRGED
jgi:type II secretory pathway pseudopilin PulG